MREKSGQINHRQFQQVLCKAREVMTYRFVPNLSRPFLTLISQCCVINGYFGPYRMQK